MSDPLASGILDSLIAFACVLDTDGTLLDANSAALAPAGLTLDAVRGKKFWDCHWWDYSEAVRHQVREACERAARDETVRFAGAARTAGGGRVGIDLRITPLRDAGGRITHLLPAAAELLQSEEDWAKPEPAERNLERGLLARMIEHAPIAIAVLEGEELLYTLVNPTYQAVLGSKENLLGRTFAEAFPEAAARGAAERLRAVLHGDQPLRVQEFETPIMGRAELTYWDVVAVPLPREPTERAAILLLKWDVTERKQAERALSESEARYRELVQNANSAIVRWARDGTITFFNEYAQELFGYRAEEVIGKHAGILLPEREATGRDLTHLVADIAAHPENYRESINENVRRDGQRLWMVWTNHAVRNEQGEVVEILAIGTDITRLKDAEDALRASETRERAKAEELEIILEAVPAGVFIAEDPGCRVIRANRTGYKMLGMSERENLSKTPNSNDAPARMRMFEDGAEIAPDDLPVQRAARGERVRNIEMEVVLEDGRVRHMLGNAAPLLDATGRPRGAVGAFTDITERTRAEDALRRTHGLLEGIAHGTEDLIAAVDEDFRYLFFNEAYRREFKKLWGLDIEVGASMLEGLAAWPQEERKAKDIWTRALNGESFIATVEFGPAEDEKQVYDLRFNPLYDAQGRRIGAAHILRNVTEQTRMQEAMQRNEAALREADRRKDEFLAMLAHELRNPLAPITNAVQLLKLNPGSLEKERWVVDIIERQGGQLSRLIDDLLDVARIARGRIELRRTDIELGTLAERAAQSWRGTFDDKGLKLSVSRPERPVPVHADAARITQVLDNLLDNAAKYTEPGGQVRLSVREDGGEAVLSVEDTGIGLPRDLLPRVFELFEQAEPGIDRTRGGLGLGLNLVKRLVEKHGGTVEARSEGLGRGSEFVIRLPIAATPDDEAQRAATTAETPGASRRVLVIEDNPDVADSLQALLEAMGHQVSVARDGEQGLAAVPEFQPDLVLIDLGLPDMPGYSVAERLRESHPPGSLTLVALTGYGREEDRQRSRDAGFDEHLTKPASVEALLKVLAA